MSTFIDSSIDIQKLNSEKKQILIVQFISLELVDDMLRNENMNEWRFEKPIKDFETMSLNRLGNKNEV